MTHIPCARHAHTGTGIYIEGRPDLGAGRDTAAFGVTWLKRFPPFVYSLLGGLLVHRVIGVEAQWYTPAAPQGQCLERLVSPKLTIYTVCGQAFFSGTGREKRAQACALPRPEAVQCGRCNGGPAVFSRTLGHPVVLRQDARQRIGCVVEVP